MGERATGGGTSENKKTEILSKKQKNRIFGRKE
nr:MAG TPA: hypothetical protein [Caudoviricetes sp.]